MPRRSPPRLVRPGQEHDRFLLSRLDVPTTRDLAQRDREQTTQSRDLPRQPPSVTGSWANDEAGPNLVRILAELGIITDDTRA